MSAVELNKLKARLEELVKSWGLTALKTGTEVEDMSFEEIGLLRDLSRDLIPLFVKIGGPEARNDMRELEAIGVDGLIAPMIESVYALRKFIFTLKETLSPFSYRKLEKGINLETIDGFRQMNGILSAPETKELHQITAARTDLSGSMGVGPDADQVLEICSTIVTCCREQGLRTSVGGKINPGIAGKLIDFIRPDTINTRHMVLDSKASKKDPGNFVLNNLLFEADLYQYLGTVPSRRQKAHQERARIIRERLEARDKTGSIITAVGGIA